MARRMQSVESDPHRFDWSGLAGARPESVAERRAIDEALREAARDARRLHKAFGRPMATWKDGQVVWVQPDDIQIDGPDQESDSGE